MLRRKNNKIWILRKHIVEGGWVQNSLVLTSVGPTGRCAKDVYRLREPRSIAFTVVRLEGGERRQHRTGPGLGPEALTSKQGSTVLRRVCGSCDLFFRSCIRVIELREVARGGPCQTWREGPRALDLDHAEKGVIHHPKRKLHGYRLKFVFERWVHIMVLVSFCVRGRLRVFFLRWYASKIGSQALVCFCVWVRCRQCVRAVRREGKRKTVEEPVAASVRVIFLLFVVSVPSCFARVVGARDSNVRQACLHCALVADVVSVSLCLQASNWHFLCASFP